MMFKADHTVVSRKLLYIHDLMINKCEFNFIEKRLIESSWFTWVAQSNHVVMDIHDDVIYDSWLSLQVNIYGIEN